MLVLDVGPQCWSSMLHARRVRVWSSMLVLLMLLNVGPRCWSSMLHARRVRVWSSMLVLDVAQCCSMLHVGELLNVIMYVGVLLCGGVALSNKDQH
jgi:hypothetical protein